MKNLAIKAAIAKLENANISVSEYKENDKLCGYELNTYTDCGVNQIVFVDFRDTDKSPKSGKDFIELYNEIVKDIDIEEEIKLYSEDKSYMQQIGYELGIKDFKDWKENLQNIFSSKTAEQRQFEQVVDKFRSHIAEMERLLNLMPVKDNVSEGCQRTFIATQISNLDYAINGITLEDFTPNEYSGDFKLSYS
jgi:hypothetical protein